MKPETAKYSWPVGDDELDCVMDIEEFNGCVEEGGFIDYDGFGYPVKDNRADTSILIYPSEWPHNCPSDATHIIWFNR